MAWAPDCFSNFEEIIPNSGNPCWCSEDKSTEYKDPASLCLYELTSRPGKEKGLVIKAVRKQKKEEG